MLRDREVPASQVLPSEINRFNSRVSLAKHLLQLFNKYHQSEMSVLHQLVDSSEELGFYVSDYTVCLKPVNLVEILKKKKLPMVLQHDGQTSAFREGTVASILSRTIWGSRNSEDPTYVKTLNSRLQPASLYQVKLFIDPVILMEDRSIFCDPEQMLFEHERHMLGEGFFVMGGIPTRSIIGIGSRDSAFENSTKVNT